MNRNLKDYHLEKGHKVREPLSFTHPAVNKLTGKTEQVQAWFCEDCNHPSG